MKMFRQKAFSACVIPTVAAILGTICPPSLDAVEPVLMERHGVSVQEIRYYQGNSPLTLRVRMDKVCFIASNEDLARQAAEEYGTLISDGSQLYTLQFNDTDLNSSEVQQIVSSLGNKPGVRNVQRVLHSSNSDASISNEFIIYVSEEADLQSLASSTTLWLFDK